MRPFAVTPRRNEWGPERLPTARDGQRKDKRMAKDVTTYTLKQAVAAQVEDHIEIAVEAEDGTTFKIRATAEQLDALTGDLEMILDGDDADEAA